ncbi:MAG: hypothetical protein EOP49_02975 [Sphingobacteriales bacterium]|nr:MAG: hypothetical protein EOP49_02975 [Sphingobacteriales bacterium]
MYVTIPPVRELRTHILISLNFLGCYLNMIEAEMIPHEMPDFLDKELISAMGAGIALADPKEPIETDDEDIRYIYAGYMLSSRLLLTEWGESISEMILKQLPEGHDMKEFENFRGHMLRSNAHLIKDAEEKLADEVEGFAEWKKKLEDLVLD